MSFTELETLIDSRADLLARLTVLERDDVAELVTAKVADDIRESEYAEFDMIHAPERWDADFEGGCA